MELTADYHIHTVYAKHSDADLTVENILKAAAAAGLRQIVILEHHPIIETGRPAVELWAARRHDRSALDAIARDLGQWAPRVPEVRVWRGVEVDADPLALDGSTMLDDFAGLDVVFGSTHVFPGGGAFWFEPVQLMPDRAYDLALRWRQWAVDFVNTGRLHVLAHPGDLAGVRGLVAPFDDPQTQEFFEPLLDAMAARSVAFELNELLGGKLSAPYRDTYAALVRQARRKGLRFAPGSDAHRVDGIGKFSWVRELIAEARLTAADLWTPPASHSSGGPA
jgi:histidinol phosphatase-like PHP family hydrolase